MQGEKKHSINVVTGSTYSINGMEDVDDLSTAIGDLPAISELDDKATEQIFTTYYVNKERTYSQDLNVTSYQEEVRYLFHLINCTLYCL